MSYAELDEPRAEREEANENHYEDNDMSQAVDLNSIGGGGGWGGFGGWGGGGDGIGLLAVLALLGRGDFGRRDGCDNHDGCVTNATLAAALGNVNDTQMNAVILKALGDIQAAVPAGTAQVQNGLLEQTIGFNNNIAQLALGVQQGFSNNKDAVQAAAALNLSATQNVNQTVLTSTCDIKGVVHSEGELTRALINNLNTENLQRIITTQAAQLAELAGEHARARDRHGIEITMVQNQAQAQLQAQKTDAQFSHLAHLLADTNQVARATNANFVIGNTGAVATGPQTANPVNVKG